MSLRIAVVGAGYWGPNLVRNFRNSEDWDLVAVCDLDAERARKVVGARSTVAIETSFDALLARDDIDALAIATPAQTHSALATKALRAGKHVLVEKPLASNLRDARALVAEAEQLGLVLMTDHVYCYTAAVTRIAEMIADGVIGDLLFIDSVRINLGLVQPDVDVFWDLAPHDLSILDTIIPGGLRPLAVAAHGADPLKTGKSCVGYLNMPLDGGAVANIHVNWLSPTKIRQMVIGGSRRMLVWDDLNPQQKLAVYDRGVDFVQPAPGSGIAEREVATVAYRLGDMEAPSMLDREALGIVAREFAAAITEKRAPLTDGYSGLRVLDVLDAASISQANGGAFVDMRTHADVVEG